MRIRNDIRKCAVFVGIEDGMGEFRVFGAGFFVTYQNHGYLITAKHIASAMAKYVGVPPDHASFLIRLNQNTGEARNFEVSDVQWAFHPDENVNLAATPFDSIRLGREFDCRYLSQSTLPSKDCIINGDIGLGDICYTVDLCRLLRGKQRNIPVLRIGSVALLPESEGIPAKDSSDNPWLAPKLVTAYLVQFPGLIGIGGSPVFVRTDTDIEFVNSQSTEPRPSATAAGGDLILLGVLQASWDLPTGIISTSPRNRPEAPSDMGVVIPAERIIEMLELPALRESRDDVDRRQRLETAAVGHHGGKM